jgi:hypothetical protein
LIIIRGGVVPTSLTGCGLAMIERMITTMRIGVFLQLWPSTSLLAPIWYIANIAFHQRLPPVLLINAFCVPLCHVLRPAWESQPPHR